MLALRQSGRLFAEFESIQTNSTFHTNSKLQEGTSLHWAKDIG